MDSSWRLVPLCVAVLGQIVGISGTDGIHVEKRIDLPSCSDRFDVHRDTIIQTEDSRKMGANFLFHLEVNNHEECLRVCCETDKCDVFVFEEKFKGTCFLFQCGPPDDFRCQFTAHANYTIAVLSPVQQEQMPPFRPQMKPPTAAPQVVHLSQHEQELVSLKGNKESIKQVPVTTSPERKQTTTTAIPPLGIPMSDSGKSIDECARFQWKCHTGECIAIYNVCDGIPQCEDGSDEGPECPSQSKPKNQVEEQSNYARRPSSSSAANQYESQSSYNINPEMNGHFPSSMAENANKNAISANAIKTGMIANNMQSNDLMLPPKTMQNPPYMIHNREDPMTAPRPWPQNSMTSAGQMPQAGGGQLMIQNEQQPLRQSQQQSAAGQVIQPMYMNDAENRVFSHKNRLNMMQTGGNANDGNGYAPIFRDMYGKGINMPDYGNQPQWPQDVPPQSYLPKQQLYPQQIYKNNNWPTALDSGNDPKSIPSPNNQQQNWPNVGQSSVNSDEKPNKEDSKQEVKPKPKSDQEEEEEDKSYVDEDDEEDNQETTLAPKKSKPRKHKKPKSEKSKEAKQKSESSTFPPIYQQLKALSSDLDSEIYDHDGEADRPSGAILSLTLGVLITAILAILISCRMKTVGRRIRRSGKGPYAHDADFLVNGMYL